MKTTGDVTVRLSPEVLAATRSEAARFRGDWETGGLWLGRYAASGDYVILDHIGPGPLARHYVGSFQPDTGFQNGELRRKRAGTPGLQLIATWHLHPGAMDHPSEMDVTAARSVIDTWNLPRPEVVVGIATLPRGEFHLRTYRMTADTRAFSEVPWSGEGAAEAPPEPNATWLDLHTGRQYLAALLETAAGCGFEPVARRKGAAVSVALCDGRGRRAELTMPEEFPFQPAWLALPRGRQRISPDLRSGPRLVEKELRRLRKARGV
jgi:hypothetical protein